MSTLPVTVGHSSKLLDLLLLLLLQLLLLLALAVAAVLQVARTGLTSRARLHWAALKLAV
jgi:hypothetical protein